MTFLLSCTNLAPAKPGEDPHLLGWSNVGTPMVQVSVSGESYWFWIDTGAGQTVINQTLATKLGWSNDTATRIEVGTTTKTIDGAVFTVPSLQVAGRTVTSLECLVLGRDSLEIPLFGVFPWVSISGIVGWDLLQQGIWILDKASNTVTWRDSIPSAKGSAQWDVFPIVPDHQGRLMGLDTGANHSFLTLEGAIALLPDSPTEQQLTWLGTAGGGESRIDQRIRSVSFDWAGVSWHFDEIGIRRRKPGHPPLAGILGADLFTKTTRLVIDWPNRTLTWGP